MNKNILIVGAGACGLIAKEIAESMGCFEKIGFVDDIVKTTHDGTEVVGTVDDIKKLSSEYNNIIVAIGNSEIRLNLIRKIEAEMSCCIVKLVSPKAYVSPTAHIGKGSIIEPMAVVNSGCVIATGCIVSAGAVVNHTSMCCDGVHIDCNAVVDGYSFVPAETKICCGEVYNKKGLFESKSILFDSREWADRLNDISKSI